MAHSPVQHRFQDKVVIVTGASRGIGKSIAECFAEEGAKVVLVSRDGDQLKQVQKALESKGCTALSVPGDVADPVTMKRVVEKTLHHYGTIDILCHNAGIYPFVKLEEMTLEEWQHVIDVNLTGTFLAVKACIPWMKQQGHGKIVITSSISGPRTGLPRLAHYTASKGGVAGFIKTAAVELAKYNILINAVEPGNIITEGLEDTGSQHIQNMLKAIPLGRLGTTREVATATLFLASDDASYITGQSLIIDGAKPSPKPTSTTIEMHHSTRDFCQK